MELRRLGTSGLDVPVVGMGTWKTFDVRDPETVAHRRTVVDVALEHGTNLFDSSPMYGAAEQVLGAALAGRREQALVATKVWTPDDAAAERQIEAAPLDDAIKDRIAWRNAADLIERFRPDWRPDFELPAVPAEFVGTDLWEELPGKPGRLR